jgi:hypothetical protein
MLGLPTVRVFELEQKMSGAGASGCSVRTAITMPILPLLAVEAGLRLFGFGYPSAFTVRDNDHFTWPFS